MKARAETVRDTGACISPFNSFLLIQGLETLSLRMERQSASALRGRPVPRGPSVRRLGRVRGAPEPPGPRAGREVPAQGRRGRCSPSGSRRRPPREGRAAGRKFIEGLQLFSHLANIGDVRSLVIHPASTTHQQLTDEELAKGGVSPELIRLSIGLENAEDLLWDLEQALPAP